MHNIQMELVSSLLFAVEKHIIPKTQRAVANGNKIFGAAILQKKDLSVLISDTNNEIESPLFHGEISTLNRFFKERKNINPKDLIFLSTHEPCSMCLSAITWGGFNKIYYFFSHEQSRDSFSIPHDLKILKEVFNLDPDGYNKINKFWTCNSIIALVSDLDPKDRLIIKPRIDFINNEYKKMSEQYQENKSKNNIPLN